MANREVICANTTEWIKTQGQWDSVITSLPDADETNLDIVAWQEWFVDMVDQVICHVKPEGYAIFYQTDRKYQSGIIDKSYLCNQGAEQAKARTIFHKICLKRDVGKSDLYRPTFTHLLCYSKLGGSGRATPDVMYAGKMIYNNAMGLTGCKFACDFIKSTVGTVIDPFCGQGSILAVANKLGINAIGVDILEDQCEKARALKIIEASQ